MWCVCVCNSVQERVGNGKVVSVGGRCGCEMKSCPFFLPYNPFPFSAPFLPLWLRLYSGLSPLFLTGLTVTQSNCMKEKVMVNLHRKYPDRLFESDVRGRDHILCYYTHSDT